jgi:hypothetical protein
MPHTCFPNQLQPYIPEGKRPFGKPSIYEDNAEMDIVFWM